MATSGTYGQTRISVNTIIEHAVRRAGLVPSNLDEDNLLAAKNNLYFLLTALGNSGIDLWTVEIYTFGLTSGQYVYTLPAGSIDVIKALYRTITFPSGGTPASSDGGTAGNAFDQDTSTYCLQTASDGNISYIFTEATAVVSLGFMPYGTNTYSLVWEYSQDGVSWTTAYTASANTVYTDAVWVYQTLDTSVAALYWRVRETGGGVLSVREIVFGSYPQDIPLGRQDIDSYTQQVNKNQQARQPVQFWFNRKAISPQLYLWQVPDYDFDQLVVWFWRQVQDVGTLRDELEIPNRWIDSIVCDLAVRMLLEMPNADFQRIQVLGDMSAKARLLALAEERDDSPITILPSIGSYTA